MSYARVRDVGAKFLEPELRLMMTVIAEGTKPESASPLETLAMVRRKRWQTRMPKTWGRRACVGRGSPAISGGVVKREVGRVFNQISGLVLFRLWSNRFQPRNTRQYKPRHAKRCILVLSLALRVPGLVNRPAR